MYAFTYTTSTISNIIKQKQKIFASSICCSWDFLKTKKFIIQSRKT